MYYRNTPSLSSFAMKKVYERISVVDQNDVAVGNELQKIAKEIFFGEFLDN
jgi:hypothetical protein